MIMAWRDTEGSLNFVFLGNGRKRERDEKEMGVIIVRNWDL
jgi:hypothetical protein